jgi:hypothetical protein
MASMREDNDAPTPPRRAHRHGRCRSQKING